MRAQYIVRRIGFAFLALFVAVTVNFAIFRAVPGDAVDALQCLRCDSSFRDFLRQSLGLDQPILVQYWHYLSGLLHGDLGMSLRTHSGVWSEIVGPLGNTIVMIALGYVVAMLVGTAVGVVAAWRRDTWVDKGGMWTSLTLNSLPPQWVGLILLLYVATAVGLPTSGIQDPLLGVLGDATPWQVISDRLVHMILPSTCIAIALVGNYALITRSSMLETLGEDYILTARAKGLTTGQAIRTHAFPNARLPLLTFAVMSAGFIVGGAITVEIVFSYPGIGLRMLQAIDQRDYPVLQGIFLILATSVITANLIADLLYSKMDPRVTE